eukprot:g1993.t1
MFMDYTEIGSLTSQVLNVSSNSVNALYSSSLFTVIIVSFPFALLLSRHNTVGSILTIVFNVIAATLRYHGWKNKDYTLTLVSSVVLGFAAAGIITSYTSISKSRFPHHQQALATSIAVQSNYFGWCIGCLIPLFVSKPQSNSTSVLDFLLNKGNSSVILNTPNSHPFMKKKYSLSLDVVENDNSYQNIQVLFFGQIWLGVAALVFRIVLFFFETTQQQQYWTTTKKETATTMLMGNKDNNIDSSSVNPRQTMDEPFLSQIRNALIERHFVVQFLAYGIVGGVSFTIPAVQAYIFQDVLSYSTSDIIWTNVIFVGSGVLFGLAFGILSKRQDDSKKFSLKVITISFFVCTLALFATGLVMKVIEKESADIKIGWYAFFVFTMGIAGATSLGFIGPALHIASNSVANRVSHEVSAGLVECLIQGVGGILTLSTNSVGGLFTVAVLVFLAFILSMFIRLPLRSTEYHNLV